jgi:hypothetical protein
MITRAGGEPAAVHAHEHLQQTEKTQTNTTHQRAVTARKIHVAIYQGKRFSHAAKTPGSSAGAQKMRGQLGSKPRPAGGKQGASKGAGKPANPNGRVDPRREQQSRQGKEQHQEEQHGNGEGKKRPKISAVRRKGVGAAQVPAPEHLQLLAESLQHDPREQAKALLKAYTKAIMTVAKNAKPGDHPSANAQMLGHAIDFARARQRFDVKFLPEDQTVEQTKQLLVELGLGSGSPSAMILPLAPMSQGKPMLESTLERRVCSADTLRNGLLASHVAAPEAQAKASTETNPQAASGKQPEVRIGQ